MKSVDEIVADAHRHFQTDYRSLAQCDQHSTWLRCLFAENGVPWNDDTRRASIMAMQLAASHRVSLPLCVASFALSTGVR